MTISAAALKAKADVTRAQFNPLIRPYLVLQIGFALAISVIGIPFALIWFLGLGRSNIARKRLHLHKRLRHWICAALNSVWTKLLHCLSSGVR